jgi:hypothetical protein
MSIQALQSTEIIRRLGITRRMYQWMSESGIVTVARRGRSRRLASTVAPYQAMLMAVLFDLKRKLYPAALPANLASDLRVSVPVLTFLNQDRELWLVVSRDGWEYYIRPFSSSNKAIRFFAKMPSSGALIAVHELRAKLWPAEKQKAKGAAA